MFLVTSSGRPPRDLTSFFELGRLTEDGFTFFRLRLEDVRSMLLAALFSVSVVSRTTSELTSFN